MSVEVVFSSSDNLRKVKVNFINYSGWRIPTAVDALRKELELVFGANSLKQL
jgi:hypothetical protein